MAKVILSSALVSMSFPNKPNLNITPVDLTAEGLTLSQENNTADLEATAVGFVTKLSVSITYSITIKVLKGTKLDAWVKAKTESAIFDQCTLNTDALNDGIATQPHNFIAGVIQKVDTAFNGQDSYGQITLMVGGQENTSLLGG